MNKYEKHLKHFYKQQGLLFTKVDTAAGYNYFCKFFLQESIFHFLWSMQIVLMNPNWMSPNTDFSDSLGKRHLTKFFSSVSSLFAVFKTLRCLQKKIENVFYAFSFLWKTLWLQRTVGIEALSLSEMRGDFFWPFLSKCNDNHELSWLWWGRP